MREVGRRWRPGPGVRLGMLGALRRGAGDPAYRRESDGTVWRTTTTPDGPATQRLVVEGDEVVSASWGPGADWVTERVPALLGALDDPDSFDPSPHPLVAELWKRLGPLRFPSTGRVFDVLAPAVLEQRVTGREARRSWRVLVDRYGEPAPGPAPAGMRVPPIAEAWRAVPSWEWHRAGVEKARSSTVLRAALVAQRLESATALPPAEGRARLRLVPGVGVWTAAEVAQRAWGDADAVPYGDFHIAHNVVFALTGDTDGTDERMAELLEPWEGHRGRVVRLIELAGISRPARGPRYAPIDFRAR